MAQFALFRTITKKSPVRHALGMRPAAAIAFGSASSAVTLPTNMDCCQKLGYDRGTLHARTAAALSQRCSKAADVVTGIVRFCLSLGATISLDGTALYFGPVVIWLADQAGLPPLDFSQIIILSIISTLASAGAAPTPEGGVAFFILIYEAVFPGKHIPAAFAFVIAIDWFVDRAPAARFELSIS